MLGTALARAGFEKASAVGSTWHRVSKIVGWGGAGFLRLRLLTLSARRLRTELLDGNGALVCFRIANDNQTQNSEREIIEQGKVHDSPRQEIILRSSTKDIAQVKFVCKR